MSRRPPLRAVLATSAAAALLVGGANLASYAATHHGHGAGASASRASQPKTITFTLGSNNQTFNAGSVHLFTGKVPPGTYATSISGFLSSTTNDSYTCLLVDKKALLHLVQHPSSLSGAQRLYSAVEQSGADNTSGFGLITEHNPVAKVDRSTIVYGCVFNGPDPYRVARPLEFALTPVKASHQRGKKFNLPTMKVRQLAHALR